MPIWAKITALGGLGIAVIIYLVMFIVVSQFLKEAVNQLQL
jgi:hypothetical protein